MSGIGASQIVYEADENRNEPVVIHRDASNSSS